MDKRDKAPLARIIIAKGLDVTDPKLLRRFRYSEATDNGFYEGKIGRPLDPEVVDSPMEEYFVGYLAGVLASRDEWEYMEFRDSELLTLAALANFEPEYDESGVVINGDRFESFVASDPLHQNPATPKREVLDPSFL
jgi:hypothetical protein